MLTEKTFDTGIVSINYVEGPSSGITLVMLHGATLRWQHFLPVLPYLSFRYHTYALDLRGHGRSSRAPGTYRNVDYAEDIICFLRERVGEPAVVLGHSLGGAVAIQVAAEAPALIHAVVLEEPSLYRSFAGNSPAQSVLPVWRSLAGTEVSFAEKVSTLAARDPNRDSASLRANAKSFSQLDPDVITHLMDFKFGEHFDLDAALAKIVSPVLLLQGNPELGGRDDGEVEQALSSLADATHVRLAELGHNLHTPQPIAFCQIVMNFLESL